MKDRAPKCTLIGDQTEPIDLDIVKPALDQGYLHAAAGSVKPCEKKTSEIQPAQGRGSSANQTQKDGRKCERGLSFLRQKNGDPYQVIMVMSSR